MAKVTRDLSARSYIATENFVGDFLNYVVTKVNFNTVGSLPQVTVDSTKCPAGRVLRENGRKLAPGINPNVPTYMVGVYDNQSGLSGFIDPNSPVFAPYNNNRPNFLVDNVDPGNGAIGGGSNLTDRGAPVLTNGLVSAATTVSAGLSVTAGTSVSAGTTVTAGTGITSTTGDIKATTGNLVATAGGLRLPVGKIVGSSNMASGSIDGTFRKLAVSGTGCTASSYIFLTYRDQNNAGVLSVEAVGTGTFTIVSSNQNDGASVNWLIIN